MPLLAEEVVQEWLNRQGFFTIRGIKAGNSEIDLLAVRVVQYRGPLCQDRIWASCKKFSAPFGSILSCRVERASGCPMLGADALHCKTTDTDLTRFAPHGDWNTRQGRIFGPRAEARFVCAA